MNFLNIDSPFMTFLSKIIDCILLSVLWIIFSLPIITIGASTTAMYYCVIKTLHHDRGYLFQEFIHAFKSNFKQSTLAFLLLLVTSLIFYVDIVILTNFEEQTAFVKGLTTLFYVLIIFELFFSFFLFAYIGRFSNSLKHILKNVLLLIIAHLPKTMLIVIILSISTLFMWLVPILIFLAPALSTWLASYILESIYAPYLQQVESVEDKESKELEQ